MISLFTMRANHFWSKSGPLALMVFTLASCQLTTSVHQLANSSSSLGGEGVSGDTIVSDLQSGNRGIFAAGYVSGQLTLLVSGPGDHKNPTGGFLMPVQEAPNGVFKITSVPVPVSSGIPSDAGVKFICKDSSGDNLVAMSGSEVGAVLLPSGHYEKAEVTNINAVGCYQSGSLHLTSSEAGYFYAVSDASFRKCHFDAKSIKASTSCVLGDILGQLCINDDSIFFDAKCGATAPSDIISGTVGIQNAYLFDGSNTVYAFAASVFKNKQSVKLTKRSKEVAFIGSDKPNTATAVPEVATPAPDHFWTACYIVWTVFCIGSYVAFFVWKHFNDKRRALRMERNRLIMEKIIWNAGGKGGEIKFKPPWDEYGRIVYKYQCQEKRRKERAERKKKERADKGLKGSRSRSRSRSRSANRSSKSNEGGKSASKSKDASSSSPASKKRL